VFIELDCIVVDDIWGILNHRTEFSVLCVCKTIMHSLSNYSLSFIRWQANNVAYLLTQATLLSYISRQIFDYISSFIVIILMNEKKVKFVIVKKKIVFGIYFLYKNESITVFLFSVLVKKSTCLSCVCF